MRHRFIREAQAASSLDHPNICTIFDVEETEDGEIFIAMAYYDGETLAAALARGPFELSKALDITIQAARGLAAAHEELIIHRDIKPANLILAPGGTVKILDFGIAKQKGDPRASETGVVVGTPAYMSPEQLRGEPVDQRTDIWSLGVVLYEMITGMTPFGGEDTSAIIDSVLRKPPAAVSQIHPGIPARIDRIIERALTKELRHRYERIDAMVHDLLAAQTSLDSDAITLRRTPTTIKTSIAVLPFEDMSPSKDQEFLCDGIAEEVLRAISRTPDLYVASRTSCVSNTNTVLQTSVK